MWAQNSLHWWVKPGLVMGLPLSLIPHGLLPFFFFFFFVVVHQQDLFFDGKIHVT